MQLLVPPPPPDKMIRIFIAKISLVSYFSLPVCAPIPTQRSSGRVSIWRIWATHVARFPFIFRERRRLENNLLLLPFSRSFTPILRCIGHITTPAIRHDENPGWRMGGRADTLGEESTDEEHLQRIAPVRLILLGEYSFIWRSREKERWDRLTVSSNSGIPWRPLLPFSSLSVRLRDGSIAAHSRWMPSLQRTKQVV